MIATQKLDQNSSSNLLVNRHLNKQSPQCKMISPKAEDINKPRVFVTINVTMTKRGGKTPIKTRNVTRDFTSKTNTSAWNNNF